MEEEGEKRRSAVSTSHIRKACTPFHFLSLIPNFALTYTQKQEQAAAHSPSCGQCQPCGWSFVVVILFDVPHQCLTSAL
jgi:hypothetical protein